MKNHRNPTKGELASLCAEVRPDDGIPPHILKKRQNREVSASTRVPPRSLPYLKAVRQCLDAAFGSVCADPLLTDLTVRSLEPLGKGAKLLVVVEAPSAESPHLRIIEASLQRAAGLLRSVVAGEVRRKRTPHLRFRVIPRDAGQPGAD
jgi:hypothetical protein